VISFQRIVRREFDFRPNSILSATLPNRPQSTFHCACAALAILKLWSSSREAAQCGLDVGAHYTEGRGVGIHDHWLPPYGASQPGPML
jgi:hypothetical protein